jgi:hypothetical protein
VTVEVREGQHGATGPRRRSTCSPHGPHTFGAIEGAHEAMPRIAALACAPDPSGGHASAGHAKSPLEKPAGSVGRGGEGA